MQSMEIVLSYRYRAVTASEVIFIRKLIAEHPASSRRDLSKKLCQAWNWVQANGALRDMVVCRGLMLQLHREEHIELPAGRRVPTNPLSNRAKSALIIALACFAVWAAGKVFPAEHREVIDSVAWLRYVGLAGLLVFELKLLFSVYKAVVISGKSQAEAQAKLGSEGMPSWASKAIAIEAALWRKVWLHLKHFFGR